MFKNINELLTFISIIICFAIAFVFFIKAIFSINAESFSITKMMVEYQDNEDE